MKKAIYDWIKVADNDMNINKSLLKDDPIQFAGVVFHSQQAIEKYFKAFLLDKGWNLQKTHDLTNLYGEVQKYIDLEIDLNVLIDIDNMYLDARYPDNYHDPNEEEAKKSYELAEKIEKKIKDSFK